MDAFEKWWDERLHTPLSNRTCGDIEAAFIAGHAEGFREGMRRAAEIADGQAKIMEALGQTHTAQDSRDRCFARGREATAIYNYILSESDK